MSRYRRRVWWGRTLPLECNDMINGKGVHWLLAWSVAACLMVLSVALTWAEMPQEYYAALAQRSVIKAIAVVEEVKVIERTWHYNRKKVLFRTEQGVTGGTPAVFAGYCSSVDHFWQRQKVGGDILYYPRKGDRVFVTVSADGGSITSYTPLTPEIERAAKKYPQKIRFSFGNAIIEEEK